MRNNTNLLVLRDVTYGIASTLGEVPAKHTVEGAISFFPGFEEGTSQQALDEAADITGGNEVVLAYAGKDGYTQTFYLDPEKTTIRLQKQKDPSKFSVKIGGTDGSSDDILSYVGKLWKDQHLQIEVYELSKGRARTGKSWAFGFTVPADDASLVTADLTDKLYAAVPDDMPLTPTKGTNGEYLTLTADDYSKEYEIVIRKGGTITNSEGNQVPNNPLSGATVTYTPAFDGRGYPWQLKDAANQQAALMGRSAEYPGESIISGFESLSLIEEDKAYAILEFTHLAKQVSHGPSQGRNYPAKIMVAIPVPLSSGLEDGDPSNLDFDTGVNPETLFTTITGLFEKGNIVDTLDGLNDNS